MYLLLVPILLISFLVTFYYLVKFVIAYFKKKPYNNYAVKTVISSIVAIAAIVGIGVFAPKNNTQTISQKDVNVKFNIVKEDKLSMNRVNLTVIPIIDNGTLTKEYLEKIADNVTKEYKRKHPSVYGIYITFTDKKENKATYGTAEYGPNGDAGYKNPNPKENEYKLTTTNIYIPSEQEIKQKDERDNLLQKMQPLKNEISKNTKQAIPYAENISVTVDSESIFDLDFDVAVNTSNKDEIRQIGVQCIKNALAANSEYKFSTIAVVMSSKIGGVMMSYDVKGDKFVMMSNGVREEFKQ